MKVLSSLFGFFLLVISIMLLLLSFFPLIISSILSFFSFNTPDITNLGIISILLGIIGSLIGFKIFYENQTDIIKLFLGFFGLFILAVGVLIMIMGAGGALGTSGISLLIGIFSGVLVSSLGLSFISYGFEIQPLKFFSNLLFSLKKFL